VRRPVSARFFRQLGGLRLRDDRGAAAVEFAFVFPLLLVIVLGIFEFGRAWNIDQVITDAAREGARRAVISNGSNPTQKQGDVVLVVNNRLGTVGLPDAQLLGTPTTTACAGWSPPVLTPAQAQTVTLAGCGWGGARDSQARVLIRVPFPFQFLGPVMGLIGGGGIGPVTLRADVSMRNE
jgi:Flp pilus assembly protein TadG